MSHGPKTVAQAMALPLVKNILQGGFFLGAGKVEGDTIISFVDKNDEPMRVTCIRRAAYGPDEWVKVPA
jgi:hypothetical protein